MSDRRLVRGKRSRSLYSIFLRQVRERDERATIDFEGRSACDLKRRGAWLYSKHPTTQILCLAWKLPGMREPKLWHRAHPELGIEESEPPWALFHWIEAGGLVEAHNAFFEMCMWMNVGVPEHGWPVIPESQWRCSAAKAAAHALPRDLKGAADALELPVRKDERGKALINKYSKPKRLTKWEKELHGEDAIIFNEDVQGLQEFWEYCRQDVRTEERVSETIADLSDTELKVWQITNRMNFRGVLIDRDLARSALALAAKAKAKANREFFKLTGINSATQRAVVKAWLATKEGLELPDTKAKTLEFYLDRNPVKLSKRARRVLEIVKTVNRTSTNKFKRMLECVDDDGRARELLAYCGAERTGRFAGRGIQVQNLPKGRFAKHLPKGEAMDIACADVKTQNLEWCEAVHGDVMNLIASCLRGAIIAPPGKDLLIADYAAIEARCVLWEAGATKALEVFKGGGDIYCDMASGIYGYQIVKDEWALAKNPGAKIAVTINSMGATQRDFGKVAVLGLGYGMGYLKFLITLRTYNIYLTREEVLQMMGPKRFKKYLAVVRRRLFPSAEDFDGDEKKLKKAEREARIARRQLSDEQEDAAKVLHELALCKYTVDTYRRRYPEVPQMWKDQEAAAIRAVQTGKAVRCGVFVWKVVGRFLKCRLPSGRCLHYANPEIKMAKTSWGESRPSLRFMGRNQTTGRWTRQASYGGKIVENETQAVARDIMCVAKVTLEDAWHELLLLLLSVHDEVIGEIDESAPGGIREELEVLMADLPECYAGCPITAEARRLKRYRK